MLQKNIRRIVSRLDYSQLTELRQIIDDLLTEIDQPPDPPERTNREVVERKAIGSITYQFERVYCGKENCHCCPHGPYWYAYYRVSGRVISKYIGKKFKSYVTHPSDKESSVT